MMRIPDLVAQCLACILLCTVISAAIVSSELLASATIPHLLLLAIPILIALGLMLALIAIAAASNDNHPATIYVPLAAMLVLLAPLCALLAYTSHSEFLTATLLSVVPGVVCTILAIGLACTVHSNIHEISAILILAALFLPVSPLGATLIIAFLAARTLRTQWAAVVIIAALMLNTPMLKSVRTFTEDRMLTACRYLTQKTAFVNLNIYQESSRAKITHDDVDEHTVDACIIYASWSSLFDNNGMLRPESKKMHEILTRAHQYTHVNIELFSCNTNDCVHLENAAAQLHSFLATHSRLTVSCTVTNKSVISGIISGIQFTFTER